MAEQGSHKPRVGGSIPPTATNIHRYFCPKPNLADDRGWVRTALGEGRVAIVELGADGAVRLGSADGAEHVLAGGGQR